MTTSAPRAHARPAALAGLCTVQLMIILAGAIVTTALPRVRGDLPFPRAAATRGPIVYVVTFAVLLLLSGLLGDSLDELLGGAWVFLGAMCALAAAAPACALAGSADVLVIGQALQGIGAALASGVVFGAIARLYPDPCEHPRVFGIYGGVSAVGASTGAIAGGPAVEVVGWQGVFVTSVLVGALALGVGNRLSDNGHRTARHAGIGRRLGVDGLAAFVGRMRHAYRLRLARRILRNRPAASGACGAMTLVFVAGLGFQFLSALHLQRVLDLDSLRTGLACLPAPLLLGPVSVFFSWPT